MPAEHDLDPPAMNEQERRDKRRYHAAFAFEMMHPAISRAQFGGGKDEEEGESDGDT